MPKKHVKMQSAPNQINDIKKPNCFGERHVQAILMFSGMVLSYFLRVNMPAALVAITTHTSNPNIPFYAWDIHTASMILSSFFCGYLVAQLPSGLLAKRFGAKIIFSLATAICATLTLLLPLAARLGGWKLVCAVRMMSGLMQGVVYPCVHTLLAKWAPITERGFIATAVYSGAQLGTVIVLATSGFVFESWMGWPGLFYISGGIGFIWVIVFYIFGADSPEESKRISMEEKEYIESLTGSHSNAQEMPIPWKEIFTSVPFYALTVAHCGYTWGFYTLLTELPTYLSSVLLLNVRANALLSALPYSVMWVMCLIVSPISDWLINRRYLSVTAARKIFNTIGQWVPMVCHFSLGYIKGESAATAMTMLTICVGCNAASYVGYLVNHMDLSPNFAGTLMGITNTVSNSVAVFAPLVVGSVVTDVNDPYEWRHVFYITSAIYFVCNSVFIVFGSANVQKWNGPVLETSRPSLFIAKPRSWSGDSDASSVVNYNIGGIMARLNIGNRRDSSNRNSTDHDLDNRRRPS